MQWILAILSVWHVFRFACELFTTPFLAVPARRFTMVAMNTRTNHIPNEKLPEFVQAFCVAARDGGSTKDIAQKFGVDEQYVTSRATNLRKAGVPLPKLQGGRGSDLDVDSLNALITQTMNPPAPTGRQGRGRQVAARGGRHAGSTAT